MKLNLDQILDLNSRKVKLRALAHEAKMVEVAVIRRRRSLDAQFAAEWSEIVRLYGEKNAPPWNESLRGPKPNIEVTA